MTHPAQPTVARRRQSKGDLPAVTPHHLLARLEVEVEAARRLRHRRRRPPTTRTIMESTLYTWVAVSGTSSTTSDSEVSFSQI